MRDDEFLDRIVSSLGKGPRTEVEAAAAEALVLLVFPERRDHAVEASREDPWSWEAVRALVELLRGRDPDALKEPPLFDWILDGALGAEKPRRPGPKRWKTYSRNQSIALAVYYLRLGGHTVESAFLYVGDRLNFSAENVHAIWYGAENAAWRERLQAILGRNPGGSSTKA